MVYSASHGEDKIMRSKVYVLQELQYDFRSAEQYGDVVFLTHRRDDFTNVVDSENNARLIGHLRHKLRDFDSDRDFLIYCGSPYVWAMACAILASRAVRKFKFLRWDSQYAEYIPLTINI